MIAARTLQAGFARLAAFVLLALAGVTAAQASAAAEIPDESPVHRSAVELAHSILGDGDVSFTLLGPAISRHANTNSARIVGTYDSADAPECAQTVNAVVLWDDATSAVMMGSPGLPATTPPPHSHYVYSSTEIGKTTRQVSDNGRTGTAYETIGQQCRTLVHTKPLRRWNQSNPGIGLQVAVHRDDEVRKLYVNFVIDSLGMDSVAVGGSWQKMIASAHGFRVDAGATGGIWWRSWIDYDETIHRALVPLILPAVSITHEPSGLGVDIIAAPGVSINGKRLGTSTLMLQSTYKF